MKRHGHLFERVVTIENFLHAFRRARRGKRTKHQVAAFDFRMEWELLDLIREVESGAYRPRPYRTFYVHDPKRRRVSAAHFRDRVVHHAVCQVLDPLFERWSVFDSYACRVGKGNLAAVQRLRALTSHHAWYVKLDVRHYFETVDHGVLLALLGRLVRDRRVLELAATILGAGAREPGIGLPIGNLTSQHFGNLLLGRLDHHLREKAGVPAMVRYMDDIVLLGPDRVTVRRLRDQAAYFVERELHQQIKREATRLGPVSIGVPFLGFRIWPRLVRLDAARATRFRGRVRKLERALARGTIDEVDAARRAQSLFAWAEQADTWRLRSSFLERSLARL